MGNVVKEMGDETPNRFFWFDVLLAALVAIPAVKGTITIQADLFLPFLCVGQCKILAKIMNIR